MNRSEKTEAAQLRAKSRAIDWYVRATREASPVHVAVWHDQELKALEMLAQSQLVLAAALEFTGPFERGV